jgi:probable rRNA maturation factor
MITIKTRDGIDPSLLRKAARAALKQQAAKGKIDLTIALSDDEELRRLNKEFLGSDKVTDVLSFPAEEIDPATGTRYLGDIVISVAKADRQSQKAGNALDAELQLLVVHGVLHLLGHDHARAKEKQIMWSAQSEILNSLGLGKIKITE